MLFNKKASLEMSIQAIVIIVLAMTLLGLGLGFVKNMFGNIESLSRATFDKVADQLQRDLVSSNEKLIFSQTKINLERGKSALLGFGVKNDGGTPLSYWAEFSGIKCPNACPIVEELNEGINEQPPWFTFKYNKDGQDPKLLYKVGAADQQVNRVDLSIPKSAAPGLYLLGLTIYDASSDGQYASTEIFVTVS